MRESVVETVHPARWPNFPGETEGRNLAIADINALDEAFHGPRDPDWTAITNVFRAEELAADEEATQSAIYDYEVEMQKPVPAFDKPSMRQRTKAIMGRASETVRETSISVAAIVQAKVENSRGKRGKIAAAVAGAVVLGGLTYLEYKGISGTAAVQETQPVHHNAVETVTHHQEHIRQVAKVALHSGDNPWTVAESQLHAHSVAHPSDARIVADDARLLKLNHISTLQAMKLHVGDKLKLLKVW